MAKSIKWVAGDGIGWVSVDGSYGANEIMLFDARQWTNADWNELDEASDSDKAYVAEEITRRRRRAYKQLVKELVDTGAISVDYYELNEDGVTETDADGNAK